ncbi:MAG: iron-sulfur cluster assembly scaffold protein [Ardenticatenaceae bacterium]
MYSRQDFMEFILDHYESPRNKGSLSPASIVMKGGNPGCGDKITLYLRINAQRQVIEQITFTGEGCTISQAAASLTTSKIKGQSLAYIRTLRASDLLEDFGPGVMRSRRRCATLALHTLRAALTQYLQNQPSLAPITPADEKEVTLLQFERQNS